MWHNMDPHDNDSEARDKKYPRTKIPTLGKNWRHWRTVSGLAFSELDIMVSAGYSVPVLP